MSGLEGICLCAEFWIVFLNNQLQNNPGGLLKMQIIRPCLKTIELESEGGIQEYCFKILRDIKDLSWRENDFSHRPPLLSPLLIWSSGSQGPLSALTFAPAAHLVCPTCELTHTPTSPSRSPTPRGDNSPAKARPHAGPSQSGAAISDVGLREAPSRPRSGGTGSGLGLRAPGSGLGGTARAGGETLRAEVSPAPPPAPPCRGLPGTRATDCRAGRPLPSRPGRAAARAARSCTVSASSCRVYSSSWPSAR